MPSPEWSARTQTAVYWPLVGNNAQGEFVVNSTPQQLSRGNGTGGVRWELGRTQSVNAEGNTIATDGYLHVGFRMSIADCLWQGTLAQLPNPISGITNVMRVVDYAE